MNSKNSYRVILIILILGGGLLGTYIFATLDTIPRGLKDLYSMLILVLSLLIAGTLIVRFLSQTPNDPPE